MKISKYLSNIFKLPNGLTCLHLPVSSSESVIVSLLGKVGRRAEKENEIGAAHFLEHLFFDGTTSRPSNLAINKFIESYGGKHNGSTSQETVEYFAKVLSKDAEAAFDFISDIFLNSLLKEIETERKVIAQEAAAKRDNPDDILFRLNLANLYPGQPIGRNIYDEEINLLNMNEEVLRAYMNRTYTSKNFVLTIAGNISLDKAKDMASKYFEKIKKGKEIIFKPAEIRTTQSLVITKKDFRQSKITISFRGFPVSDIRSVYSWLGGLVLGSGFSSRLHQRLRSKQKLAYSIYTYQRKFSDVGHFGITTFVDEKNLQQAVDAIFEEVNLFLEKGISDEELQKAKNKYLASLFFKFEDLFAYSSYFAFRLLFTGNINSVEELTNEVTEASVEDVLNTAKYIFADKPKINLLTKSLDSLEVIM